MNVNEMVVLIVIVSCLAGVTNRFIKLRYSRTENDEQDEATTDRLADLENWIQILEKIVTDDKRDLEQEINDL